MVFEILTETEKTTYLKGLKSRLDPNAIWGQPGSEMAGKYGVSTKPLLDAIPMVLCTDPDVGYRIINQDQKVQEEKSLINQETNIPASISNKIKEIWNRTKDVFHKNPPLAITISQNKKGEMENRELNDSRKPLGLGMLITVIVIIYWLIKGK